MHRVHIISTGGTIEKRYVEQDGAMENREGLMRRVLSRLRLPDVKITLEELMNKDSLVMVPADREAIALRVLDAVAHGLPVIVTHGTDTLVETGLVVSACLRELMPDADVPVVFTGAMTPFGIDGSDALQNLTEAMLCTRLLRAGVFLAFQGEVFPINRVQKDRANARFVRTSSRAPRDRRER